MDGGQEGAESRLNGTRIAGADAIGPGVGVPVLVAGDELLPVLKAVAVASRQALQRLRFRIQQIELLLMKRKCFLHLYQLLVHVDELLYLLLQARRVKHGNLPKAGRGGDE